MPVLDWIGKDKVINHHLEVPYRVLEKQYTYGSNASHNMIIHGDNLVALKSLLPQYEGQVKCIYIDPPYNTAKSSNKNKKWVYSDSVDDPKIMKWLGEAVGDESEDLSRHDKWLCMMYPRLRLLEKLLAPGGIIFVSIDDNESHTLRMICDEIFGRKNFLCQFVWRSDGNFDNQAKVKGVHEYILCYIKNPELVGLPNGIDPAATDDSKIYKDEIRNTVVKNGPKNPMSKVLLKKGFPCAIDNGIIKARTDEFPMYTEDLIIKNGVLMNDVEAETGWASKSQLLEYIENGFKEVYDTKGQRTVFEITKSGAIESVKKRGMPSHVLSLLQGLGSTQNMSNELKKMDLSFDFPKPVELIKYLLGFYCEEDSIVLDSFAGSGTTAHAVLSMNKADGGNRRFILIEMEDYADSLTAKRVKSVISGYGEEGNYVEGTDGSFTFYRLGDKILDNGILNSSVSLEEIRKYIWYMETKGQWLGTAEGYHLGEYNGISYYFYYEKSEVTTLDKRFLATIKAKADEYVIYADKCALSAQQLMDYHITFKKIPRDIARL